MKLEDSVSKQASRSWQVVASQLMRNPVRLRSFRSRVRPVATWRQRLQTAGMVAAFAGCLSDTSVVAPDAFETNFAVVVDRLAKLNDVRVRAGDGTIVIDGTIGSGECGWSWRPEVDVLSSGYRVTIVGTMSGGVAIGCAYRYQVVMTGLPPRRYWIEVAHFEPSRVVKRVTANAS